MKKCLIKKCKNILSILILIILGYGISYAGKGPGSSSFEFLNIPVGSREAAMGCGTAVAHGPNAYWWNPAGLSYLERNCVSLMYNKWLEGITQQRAGFSFPMKNRAVGAVNISMLSVTGIEGYTWQDVPTGDDLKAQDFYLSYTQAKSFNNYTMGGLTLKAIVEQLAPGTEDEASAYAFAFDAGFLFSPASGLWLSGGLKNAGISGKFDQKNESLPFSVFSGFGMRINNFTLISSDVIYLDSEIKYGAGVEFDLWDLVFLRGGWNNIPDVDDTLRMGAGWKWRGILIDYAYAPYGKLGNTHRIDLNIEFGKLPLVESIYRNARSLYKIKKYDQAWIEFNKVNSLSPGYKKVKIWLKKTDKAIRLKIVD